MTNERRARWTEPFLEHPALGFVTALGSLVSASTTGLGLYSVMEPASGVLRWLGFAIVAIFTCFIQTFLVTQIALMKGSRMAREAMKRALVVALSMAISVGFSFAYYFGALSAQRVAEIEYQEHAESVLRYLEGFDQAYAQFSQTMVDLADYSESASQLEAEVGGTCGTKSGPTHGPRAELRRQDAATFRAFVPGVEREREKARELRARTEKVLARYDPATWEASARSVREVLREAEVFRQDPIVGQLKETVAARIDAGQRGFVTPSGYRFSCPDARLAALGKGVLAVEIPGIPPALDSFDPKDRGEVVLVAFGKLGSLVVGAVGGVIGRESREGTLLDLRSAYGLPLLLGTIVDLILLFATPAISRPGIFDSRKSARLNPTRVMGSLAQLVDSPPAAVGRIIDLLRTRQITVMPDEYVWCFDPPDSDEEKRRTNLLDVLVGLGDATLYKTGITLRELSAFLPIEVGEEDAARYVRVYQLANGLYGRLLAGAHFTELAQHEPPTVAGGVARRAFGRATGPWVIPLVAAVLISLLAAAYQLGRDGFTDRVGYLEDLVEAQRHKIEFIGGEDSEGRGGKLDPRTTRTEEKQIDRTVSPRAAAQFTAPSAGAQVSRRFRIEGVAPTDARRLFAMTRVGTLYYPKMPELGVVDGRFTGVVHEGGFPPGGRFDVVIVDVSEAGARRIDEWFTSSHRSGGFAPLGLGDLGDARVRGSRGFVLHDMDGR